MKCQNLPNGFAALHWFLAHFAVVFHIFSPAAGPHLLEFKPTSLQMVSGSKPQRLRLEIQLLQSQVSPESQLQTVDQQSSFPKSEGTKDSTRQS